MKVIWDKLEGGGWKTLSRKTLPSEKVVVDVWMRIPASPRSFGMSDEFGVPDAWREGGVWYHIFNGRPEPVASEYISHWRDRQPGELRLGLGWGSAPVNADGTVSAVPA
jgi:hypothetical protein